MLFLVLPVPDNIIPFLWKYCWCAYQFCCMPTNVVISPGGRVLYMPRLQQIGGDLVTQIPPGLTSLGACLHVPSLLGCVSPLDGWPQWRSVTQWRAWCPPCRSPCVGGRDDAERRRMGRLNDAMTQSVGLESGVLSTSSPVWRWASQYGWAWWRNDAECPPFTFHSLPSYTPPPMLSWQW